jgi:hypothetical protein
MVASAAIPALPSERRAWRLPAVPEMAFNDRSTWDSSTMIPLAGSAQRGVHVPESV